MIVPQLEFCRFRQIFGRFDFTDVSANPRGSAIGASAGVDETPIPILALRVAKASVGVAKRNHKTSVSWRRFDLCGRVAVDSRSDLLPIGLFPARCGRGASPQRHWSTIGDSDREGYDPGDFGMLGWDTLKNSENLPLFRFGEIGER